MQLKISSCVASYRQNNAHLIRYRQRSHLTDTPALVVECGQREAGQFVRQHSVATVLDGVRLCNEK